MGSYKIISADNHVFEPSDLWTIRLDSRFRDRAPRIIHDEEGDWWYCEGRKVVGVAPGSQAGTRFEDPGSLTQTDTLENVRPGGYIPDEHVKDMDIDGIDVSVVYPTVGLLLYSIPDGDLLTAVFQAYNDWLSEFCGAHPGRIKGNAVLNTDDIPSAIKELEHCVSMGLAGAVISVYPPQERGYFSSEYEPLWAAAQDMGIPLSLHVGTARASADQEFANLDTLTPAFIINAEHWVRMSLAHIIFSGVFERYPKLQIGSIEHDAAWVPHFLKRMDYSATQRVHREGWHDFSEMLPSDYFRKNVFVGFQADDLAIRDRDLIGVDNLQWGSDYPHQESTFPKSMEILDEILVDCTEEDKAKISGGNAARIYHLD